MMEIQIILYHNVHDVPDFTDNVRRGINNITINVTDQNDQPLTDISTDNPLLMELEFY